MTEDDLEALEEIAWNDNVYKYIPLLFYKKSKGNLRAAIRNLGGRDFDKKKFIIAGIYNKSQPNRLIGLAEMFDYKKRASKITIGYTINEKYWNKGIASNAIALMCDYLIKVEKISRLYAYVMPENIYSEKALLKNGFIKHAEQKEEKNWGGKEKVIVDIFSFPS